MNVHKTPYIVLGKYQTGLDETEKALRNRISKSKFAKLEGAIDIEAMRRKTIIGIGCGGALGFYVSIARCGASNYVLFDHDYYQDTNISNQFADISNLGRTKVEVCKEKIQDINPNASIKAIQRRLDNDISDEEFMALVGEDILSNPDDYIITAFTDDFYAQARAAALSVKYGIPFIAAQLYVNGDAAEICFTKPGVTASCPRCMLESRYQAYEKGFKNNVTSSNSTIFSTERINAACGQIALMLLQYGCKSGRYGKALDGISNRNFLQIKITPFSNVIKNNIFDEAFNKEYTFCDSTVWIPQEPNENCPLCSGEGNLLKSRDGIKDTRRNLV